MLTLTACPWGWDMFAHNHKLITCPWGRFLIAKRLHWALPEKGQYWQQVRAELRVYMSCDRRKNIWNLSQSSFPQAILQSDSFGIFQNLQDVHLNKVMCCSLPNTIIITSSHHSLLTWSVWFLWEKQRLVFLLLVWNHPFLYPSYLKFSLIAIILFQTLHMCVFYTLHVDRMVFTNMEGLVAVAWCHW